MSAAARKTADLQEKNRRAQRRFRERQKTKVAELEDRVSQLTGRISGLLADKAALDSRVGILNRVLHMREEQIEMLQRNPTANDEPMGGAEEDVHLTSQGGQPMVLTPTQMRELTRAQAVSIWKDYVNQMAVLLVDTDSGAHQSTLSTLHRLVQELMTYIKQMHMLNPLTTREFVAQKLEETSDALDESEGSERWLNLARALGLTPQQRQEIVQLRRIFLNKMNSIAQQRRDLHQFLAGMTPAPTFSRATALHSMRTHETIEALRANLKEEHLLKLDWVMTLLKHTLEPVQVARALVQAWPWAPDTLAMATWIAAEENEPDALQMLTQATRPSFQQPGQLAARSSPNAATAPAADNSGPPRSERFPADHVLGPSFSGMPSSLPFPGGMGNGTTFGGFPFSSSGLPNGSDGACIAGSSPYSASGSGAGSAGLNSWLLASQPGSAGFSGLAGLPPQMPALSRQHYELDDLPSGISSGGGRISHHGVNATALTTQAF